VDAVVAATDVHTQGAAGSRSVLLLCRFHEQAMQPLVSDERILLGDPAEDLPRQWARSVHTLVVRSNVRVDRELLDRVPLVTKVLRAGSGTDNIDLELLCQRGIALQRYPDASAAAVAELAVAALILLARLIPLAHWENHHGRHRKEDLWGQALAELDVAIWGAGPVGRAAYAELQHRCRSVSFVRHVTQDPALPYRERSLAVQRADAHVLCLPLRPGTQRLFDAGMLQALRPRRPYLIDVGRYELCDFPEVLAALRRGDLRGVFVDPVEEWHLPELRAALDGAPLNLLSSQHLGAQRVDVHLKMARWILETIDEEPVP
jgi:phosphoglycerate dehydrogenase-like enzyme